MDIESRMDLISQVGEEIITEEELRSLLETTKTPIAYDGFEPSGNPHIAQGVMRAMNIKRMNDAGVKFKMLVADWHGWANNKMGGDLEKIQVVGKYLVEIWKACGLDTESNKIEFLWASELNKDPEYWKKVMQVARHSTLNRVLRCGQIMGRSEKDVMQASQILYPCMQAADIFHLKADICQLGMDQRKVNMLAREIGPKLGYWKPVCVHHHMLMGLGEPPKEGADTIERTIDLKMSKSKPDTAIFMTDSEEDIKRKIKKAYCPEKVIHENPVMDYAQFLVFPKFGSLDVTRPSKFGGDVSFGSYAELCDSFTKGDLHPMDLKNAVTHYTNELIKPVRDHFSKGSANKLFEQVQSFTVTR